MQGSPAVNVASGKSSLRVKAGAATAAAKADAQTRRDIVADDILKAS